MLLKNLLLQNSNFKLSNDILNLDISSIEIDSRKVKENSIFFALKGVQNNGVNFISSAIKNGAKVIIFDESEDIKLDEITLLKVANPHELLVSFLQKFYSNLPENIFAITGTNGKTSVADFSRQILGFLGKKAAVIGTLGVSIDDKKIKSKLINNSLTTPDLVTFYQNLAILKENKVDFVIVEVSSIGLHQGRVDGVNFRAGAFTNFTQDHLDYHGNMEEYFAAKMILFNKILSKESFAIINKDDAKFEQVSQICEENELNLASFGFSQKADFRIKDFSNNQVTLDIGNKQIKFKTHFNERFQISNIICALCLLSNYLKVKDKDLDVLASKINGLNSTNGRMELVETLKNNAKIYIDFAHSPDALENILKSAREFAKKRLLVLFGCGGDRDAKKRPLMAKIADKLADFVIVTDDNPRTENPDLIRKEIVGAICNKNKMIEIQGRKEAIKKAISLLENDDILIIAGKGHEDYQIIGKEKLPFDEKLIIKEVLNNA